MALEDDIAKAKNLSLLNSKISTLNTQIQEARTAFGQKKTELVKKKDEEIKKLFKEKLTHPEISIDSEGDVITGKHGDNLIYSLKTSDKERILSRKLDSKEEAYKFRYTFSSRLPEYRSRTLLGTEKDEEIKNIEIVTLDNYLKLCNEAGVKLESLGIQIEYFKMDKGELTYSSKSQAERDKDDAKKYIKISLQGLLHLIGIL